MKILEAIMARRTVREYTDEPVSDEAVEQLLRAAMHAPSAGNQRPWHFIVVRNRAVLAEIAQLHPYAQMLRTAPVAILVCGDTQLDRYAGFWVQDCAAAVQNILLAAIDLGLGTVWVGVHPMEDRVEPIRRLLFLPPPVIPLALIAVGHPLVQEAREDRHDPARIHHERW